MRFVYGLMAIFIFFTFAICRASDTNKRINTQTSATSKNDSNDPEDKVVVDAAKKKAKKLGYDPKKFEIHTFFHGHDCSVYFNLPNSDVCKLKIYVRSNSGKVFYVEELKNSKWVGHK